MILRKHACLQWNPRWDRAQWAELAHVAALCGDRQPMAQSCPDKAHQEPRLIRSTHTQRQGWRQSSHSGGVRQMECHKVSGLHDIHDTPKEMWRLAKSWADPGCFGFNDSDGCRCPFNVVLNGQCWLPDHSSFHLWILAHPSCQPQAESLSVTPSQVWILASICNQLPLGIKSWVLQEQKATAFKSTEEEQKEGAPASCERQLQLKTSRVCSHCCRLAVANHFCPI